MKIDFTTQNGNGSHGFSIFVYCENHNFVPSDTNSYYITFLAMKY